MIDLHCHVLPGIDDGPETMDGSLELARAASAQGTTVLVATPHVAAAAALVIASGVVGPNPTAEAVEKRLEATARDLGTPGYDERYGWGLLDAGAATLSG